jgi:hypothetical protein
VAFFSLFALMVPPSLCRQDMWLKKDSDAELGFNTEENGSAR